MTTPLDLRTGLLSLGLLLWGHLALAQLKVNTNGYVGIGGTLPTMNLDVFGDGIFSKKASKAFSATGSFT